MERGHEFSVDLPGEGTYVIKLLEGVQMEKTDGATIGRWPAFDLEATATAKMRSTRSCWAACGTRPASLDRSVSTHLRFLTVPTPKRASRPRAATPRDGLIRRISCSTSFTGGKMASGHPSRRRSGEGSAQCPAHG
jgi:hypothetical protein